MSPEFLKIKAREICYALIRVSYYIKHVDLRQRIERSAFDLLENTAFVCVDANDKLLINRVFKNTVALDILVRMGHSLYEIEPVNANILVQEIDSFNSAMRQFGKLDEKLPSLDSFFPSSLENTKKVSSAPTRLSLAMGDTVKKDLDSNNGNSNPPAELGVSLSTGLGGNGNGNPSTEFRVNGNGINTAIRQTAIINRIRQGNGSGCRLKDLISEFPDVSERTLRYDLQKLCDQGSVERVGNGGPASHYQLKA